MGLDTVELVMAFEEEFEIEIPNEAAEVMVTVGDVVNFVASELANLGRRADRQEIFERIRRITVEHLNVKPEQVLLTTSFVEDLGAD